MTSVVTGDGCVHYSKLNTLLQHETLWRTLTMDHEEEGGALKGVKTILVRNWSQDRDTSCHLILETTNICGQWSGNEASGCPLT